MKVSRPTLKTKVDKVKVLFVCVHNSARSQMAEAFLKKHGGDRFDVESAGLEPGKLNPVAVEVMKEMGIDISRNKTKSVFDFYQQGKRYNYVITVCDESQSQHCPIFPAIAQKLHWGFADLSSFAGTLEDKLKKTREVRNQIEAKVKEWLKNKETWEGGLMQHKSKFFVFIIFLFLASSCYSKEDYKAQVQLTAQEVQRVRVVAQLLEGIDTKSLQQTIVELEKTRYPDINLQIREAMAKTYADLVKEYNVVGQKKKEWLYSMVCLNMAYIQFGGGQGNSKNSTSLNRLIYRKLKANLPLNALKQHGFLYALE